MKHRVLYHKVFLLLLLILVEQYSLGQHTSEQNHPIYKIEYKLKYGDKNALFEIASYFDSKKELTEILGYNHIVSTSESEVAKRIIDVNCIFTNDEIKIDNNTSKQDFLNFLNANMEKITYSEFATAFLITPLESRLYSTLN